MRFALGVLIGLLLAPAAAVLGSLFLAFEFVGFRVFAPWHPGGFTKLMTISLVFGTPLALPVTAVIVPITYWIVRRYPADVAAATLGGVGFLSGALSAAVLLPHAVFMLGGAVPGCASGVVYYYLMRRIDRRSKGVRV